MNVRLCDIHFTEDNKMVMASHYIKHPSGLRVDVCEPHRGAAANKTAHQLLSIAVKANEMAKELEAG